MENSFLSTKFEKYPLFIRNNINREMNKIGYANVDARV